MGIVYPPGVPDVPFALATAETIRRLKLLHSALKNADAVLPEKYHLLAAHLAKAHFINHTSREVKILVACCLADILRVNQEMTPYTSAQQLKDVLMFIIQQLRGLDNPKDHQFPKYYYLLENLSVVGSLKVMQRQLGGDADEHEVLAQLIHHCFAVLRAENTEKDIKIQNHIVDLIAPLLHDADSVGTTVLDAIFWNIVEPHKTQNREAFRVAKDLIGRVSQQIEPSVQNYFNSALVATAAATESEIFQSDKMYALLGELNDIAPDVLFAVLPQLDCKLLSENDQERMEAVRLCARLYWSENSSAHVDYPQLWSHFLGRFNDKKTEIRQLCVKKSLSLLKKPPLREEVTAALISRTHDLDESVRAEAVNVISTSAKKDFATVNSDLLDCLAERRLDKKFLVRKEALLSMGTLYRKALLSEDFTPENRQKLNWFRNKILHCYYQNSIDDKFLCEKILQTCLVPYMRPSDERMSILHQFYCCLDENASKVFDEVLKQQGTLRSLLRQLLDLHKEEEAEDRDEKIALKLRLISEQLVEPRKAEEHLKLFYNLITTDQRAFQLIDYIVGTDYTTTKVEGMVRELITKVAATAGQGGGVAIQSTLKTLLERCAPLMIDATAIQHLVVIVDKCLQDGFQVESVNQEQVNERSLQLIKVLSRTFPYCFCTNDVLGMLITFLRLPYEKAVEVAVQVFMNISGEMDKKSDVYKSLLPELRELSKKGTPRQVKHAIRCMHSLSANPAVLYSQIVDAVHETVSLEDGRTAASSLAAMAAIAERPSSSTDLTAKLRCLLADRVVTDVLLSQRGHTAVEDNMESWLPLSELSAECAAKVSALKFVARYLCGCGKTTDDGIASKAISMLARIIEDGGNIHEGMLSIIPAECAHLRLAAGKALLKVAQENLYRSLIKLEYFQVLANLIKDDCHEVRSRFALKLYKGLREVRLPVEYLSIYCLSTLIKDTVSAKHFRSQVASCLRSIVSIRRGVIRRHPAMLEKAFYHSPEYSVSYAVHLLAHHSLLRHHTDVEGLRILKECLWVLMEVFVGKDSNSETFNFMYKLLQDMKQCTDAQASSNKDTNAKLWVMCDLGITLLTYRAANFVLKPTKHTKIRLSARHFARAPSSVSNTKVYLPDEIVVEERRQHGSKTKRPVDVTPRAPRQFQDDDDDEDLRSLASFRDASASTSYAIDNVPSSPSPRKKATTKRKAKADVQSETTAPKKPQICTPQYGSILLPSKRNQSENNEATAPKRPVANGPASPSKRRRTETTKAVTTTPTKRPPPTQRTSTPVKAAPKKAPPTPVAVPAKSPKKASPNKTVKSPGRVRAGVVARAKSKQAIAVSKKTAAASKLIVLGQKKGIKGAAGSTKVALSKGNPNKATSKPAGAKKRISATPRRKQPRRSVKK